MQRRQVSLVMGLFSPALPNLHLPLCKKAQSTYYTVHSDLVWLQEWQVGPELTPEFLTVQCKGSPAHPARTSLLQNTAPTDKAHELCGQDLQEE